MRHLPAVGWFVLAVAAAGALTVLAGLRLGAGAAIFAAGSSLAAVSIIAWVVFASRRAFVEAIDAAARSIKVRPDAGDPAETLRLIAAAFHRAQAGESDAAKELLSYRAMLDAVSEPVVALSPEGEVTWANAAAEGLFGREGGLIGTPIDALFTHPTMLDLHASAVRGAGRSERVRVALATGNRALHATAVPLREPGKQGHSVLMTLRDVTSLDAAVQVKTDFVANASHELRTPISAIRTAAETLDLIDGDDEPELRARLRTIIKGNVARLEELVRDLLDLSRLESPEFRPRFSLVHMAEVEAMIHEVYHDALGQRGLRIVFEAGPQVETLRSDRSLLHLVIKNLVDNSIKFARDNSGIVVRSYRKDASVIIEVIDEGIGIPLAHQERIFERFYQVDSARSPSAPHRGSGLGLAIVKHALRALGGDVTVRSIWGQGTTMTVELRDAAVADPTIDIPAQ